MFIAIANDDHTNLLDNCDVECWNGYWTNTDNPVFMAMTFERACQAIRQYYRALDDDICPYYTIYEISEGSWSVGGVHTINLDITRHDA